MSLGEVQLSSNYARLAIKASIIIPQTRWNNTNMNYLPIKTLCCMFLQFRHVKNKALFVFYTTVLDIFQNFWVFSSNKSTETFTSEMSGPPKNLTKTPWNQQCHSQPLLTTPVTLWHLNCSWNFHCVHSELILIDFCLYLPMRTCSEFFGNFMQW